ncbi:MAG: hypothetical protein ABIR38_09155 [Chthoniobacterales bacterium]|nr:hypothetical protein [Verrucomicrobiota bacterium]
MKKLLLPALFVSLLLPACAFRSREVMVEEPPHRDHDTIVRDQIPAEGGRKIPVVQQY